MIARVAIFALLAVSPAIGVAAQPAATTTMRMGASGNFYVDWQSAPATAPTGEQVVAKGGYLFRQPVKPSGLAKPMTDVVDTQGRVVIPAGTVLIRMERIWPIYCWFDPTEIATNVGKAACVSDIKGTGHFDRLFLHEVDMTGLPQVRDKVPQDMATIAAVGYEKIALDDWESPYFVGLKFLGWKGLPGMGPLFAFVGGPGFDQRVMGGSRVKKTATPTDTAFDGASMTISAWDNNILRATVHSVFEEKRWPGFPQYKTVMIYVPAVR